MGSEKNYPKPDIDCGCGARMLPTQKMRVEFRGPSPLVAELKVLLRLYTCSGCGCHVWHEVAAKPVEGGL
jgi:hypothetical protein